MYFPLDRQTRQTDRNTHKEREREKRRERERERERERVGLAYCPSRKSNTQIIIK